MLKLKLHIARLLCIVTIFLISSNTLLNAFEINIPEYLKKLDDYKKKNVLTWHQDDISQINNALNLVKDPTEEDFFFDYIQIDQPELVWAVFSEVLVKGNGFISYSPLIKAVPLWIQNRQILI